MANAKELRKLAQTNAKLALEEKSRADQLSAFRTQLKLEGTRLKYAKQLAKFEKNHCGILQQELGCIRLDSIQISQRLDALNKWFSSSIECREGLEKAGLLSKMQRSKLKRKFDDLEPLEMYAQNESEPLKPSCVAMAASNPLSQTLYCTVPWLPVSRGNCTESISGIDSNLKSLHGGSYRKLLQSSAINSGSGSFSDDQLVGSQETDAFVSTSGKLAEENSDLQMTTSGLSGKVTKMHCNDYPLVVAEKSARCPFSIDTSGSGIGHGRKWEIMLDAIESVGFLYSEASVQVDSHAKRGKNHNKRKVPFNERIILHQEQEKITQIGTEVHAAANAVRHTCHSAFNLLGIPQECIQGLGDSFRFDCKTMAGVEKIENENYMKLLDLDDMEDEECYRRAMEMPLSPTLLEIEISNYEIIDMDKCKGGDSFHGELSNEKEILVPSHSFDVIDAKISSRNLRCSASGASFNELLHENEGLVNSFNILGNGNGCCDTMQAERASDRRTRVSEVVQMSNTYSSSNGELKFPNFSSECKLESMHDNIPA
ncbi:hypothetical protein JCGZ_11138 [Jatropha curcas]|uniref:Uncharacterized protein n=1 Tax=Jatropha curcas TaxID=180498 RepID=A0A067KQQ2_JATCU|nr:hypothetical protein JCGZ_11138 [Jatropha curcas]